MPRRIYPARLKLLRIQLRRRPLSRKVVMQVSRKTMIWDIFSSHYLAFLLKVIHEHNNFTFKPNFFNIMQTPEMLNNLLRYQDIQRVS